jgi:type VI secretion system protein ImpA
MDRKHFNLEDIFAEIPGSPDGVGYDVSMTSVYDDIKNAKFEEDHDVSFGIWERDLKKANWVLTETLAIEALIEKSKDLQILGWLVEAMIMLDGLEGILNGINLLTRFIKTFWQKSYPRTEAMESDIEQKFRILEWVYRTVTKLSRFIPFIKIDTDKVVTLYQYEYAMDLKRIADKAPSASRILERAKQEGKKNLDEIHTILKQIMPAKIEAACEMFEKIRNARECFATEIEITANSSKAGIFSDLMTNIQKMENTITRHESRIEPSAHQTIPAEMLVTSFDIAMDSRDEIYDKLGIIARRLAEIEKHSPSSYILSLVVSWKHKSLLEIMDDIKTGNTEAHRLLKCLVS